MYSLNLFLISVGSVHELPFPTKESGISGFNEWSAVISSKNKLFVFASIITALII